MRCGYGPVMLVVVSVLCGAAGCAASRRAEEGAQWRLLFDGKTLNGWVVKCKPGDAGKPLWKVDNGTILADSMGDAAHDYVWLATTEEYADFSLKLRFQAYRDSPGNSGVQIRSRYDDVAGYLDGPQVDINPSGPWRTGMVWDETRGSQRWLCPDVPAGKWVSESMAVPGLRFFYSDQGDGWNDLEIAAVGNHVTAVLNGVKVTDFHGDGVLDDAVHREHQAGEKGVIALQIHTHDRLRIRFKDIRIRLLDR
jgi:hypothetical protein